MAVPSTRTPPPSIRRLASLVEGARLACLSRAPMPSGAPDRLTDRKSTRLNSSHLVISYAVFCLKKKTTPVHPRSGSAHCWVSRTSRGVLRQRGTRMMWGFLVGSDNAPCELYSAFTVDG